MFVDGGGGAVVVTVGAVARYPRRARTFNPGRFTCTVSLRNEPSAGAGDGL